jgi:hypothetical protein
VKKVEFLKGFEGESERVKCVAIRTVESTPSVNGITRKKRYRSVGAFYS